MRDLSAFEHEVDELLRERWRAFESELSNHISERSKAGRLGSPLDAQHRIELVEQHYRGAVREVMGAALTYHKSEGPSVRALAGSGHRQLTDLASQLAKAATAGMNRAGGADGAGEAEQLRRLRNLSSELAGLLQWAEENAWAGRVGFERVVPRGFFVRAIQKAREDPWLVLAPLISLAIGMVIEATTGILGHLAQSVAEGGP